MKKILLSAAVVVALSMSTYAQQNPDSAKMETTTQPQKMGGGKEQLIKDLNLTDAQKLQWKKADEESAKKTEAIKADATLSDADKKAQLKIEGEAKKMKFGNMLTPEQKQKWDAYEKKQTEMVRPEDKGAMKDPA